jgi:hypothetical protein
VGVEVALEVEVGEVVSISKTEELLEGSIRLDVMLVLEGVLLDILINLTSHIGAADESALGLTEERAELVSNLGGDFKDRRTTLDNLLAFLGNAAAALASILDFTVDTLLELLDLSDHGGNSLTEGGEATENSLHVLIESGGRSLRGGSGGSSIRCCRGNRGGSGNRGRDYSGSDLLGGFLGLSDDRNHRGNNSGGGNGGRSGSGIIGLLGYTLLGRNRGARGGIHHTITGGRIHLK